LHVDPGLVHLLEPQLAEVVETLEHPGIARAFGADELRRDLLIPVVLLQRDHWTFRLLQHDACFPARMVDRCVLSGFPALWEPDLRKARINGRASHAQAATLLCRNGLGDAVKTSATSPYRVEDDSQSTPWPIRSTNTSCSAQIRWFCSP